MANLVQTCSKQNLKNLNCGQVDLDGSRLRVLRTSQRSLFGTKNSKGIWWFLCKTPRSEINDRNCFEVKINRIKNKNGSNLLGLDI